MSNLMMIGAKVGNRQPPAVLKDTLRHLLRIHSLILGFFAL